MLTRMLYTCYWTVDVFQACILRVTVMSDIRKFYNWRQVISRSTIGRWNSRKT
ncbi:hypothetical protein Plhal304r1_c002g0008211 [Plasmopara halstedii]